MPISPQEYTDWLKSNRAIRTILVEVNPIINGSPTVINLSNKIFFGHKPVIKSGSLQIVERLSFTSRSSLSFGDISLEDTGGDLDDYLTYVWTNTDFTALIGDVTWPKADFRQLATGTISDIFAGDINTLNLSVRDKLDRLNTQVTDTKLGGATNNKERLIPLTFGEVFNVSPLLTNPATLEYQYHNGNSEGLIEVRDNGVPVSVTDTPATGKFTLNQSPFGKITASVQGDKDGTYKPLIRDVVERIVTDFGHIDKRFTSADLDLTQIQAFDTANPEWIGAYVNNRANVLQLCNNILSSVGAQLVMGRDGLLKFMQITLPPTGTTRAANADDIIDGSLRIVSKLEVKAAHQLGYSKNYTVQPDLESGIPAEHKDIFDTQWLTVTAEDAATKNTYKLDTEPEIRETFLSRANDAQSEANRLLAIFKVPRFIYSFKGTPSMLELEIGDALTLTHARYGLSGGKAGFVIGLSVDWSNSTVQVEVLI